MYSYAMDVSMSVKFIDKVFNLIIQNMKKNNVMKPP